MEDAHLDAQVGAGVLADDDGALDPQGIQHLGDDVDVLVVGKGGSLVPGPVVLRDEPEGLRDGVGAAVPQPVQGENPVRGSQQWDDLGE